MEDQAGTPAPPRAVGAGEGTDDGAVDERTTPRQPRRDVPHARGGRAADAGRPASPPAGRSRGRAAPQGDDGVSRRVFQVTLGLIGLAAVFAAGMRFAQEKYWPYAPIQDALLTLGDAVEFGAFAPRYSIGDAPADAAREVWKVHRPEALSPGHRAVMGYFEDTADFGVRIYDVAGREVHRRTLNYHVQDPDGPTGGSEAPHAFHFLPDGSVVVNTDKGDLMARYDACGEPIWTREGAFHHSFAGDALRGGVWTWLGEGSAYDQYQYLVRFDPESGETLERIGLVEDVIDPSPEARTIFTVVPGEKIEHERGYRVIPDTFHPNDIEALSPEAADAFPDFEAGDLLMSFRNIDLVAVLDPETRALRWWSHGPWIEQHDPDFLPSGEISVFNNNRKWPRKTSSIVAIEPTTRAVRTVPVDPGHRFYTQYMGKHEYLDDGTMQVVVPFEGRALEFDAEGRLILEINNVFTAEHNAFLSDYALLPPGFFDTDPARLPCGVDAPPS